MTPTPAAPAATERRWLRRAAWERVATVAIAAGVLMMLQPFSMALYTRSFAMTLAGTLTFMIASKLPE